MQQASVKKSKVRAAIIVASGMALASVRAGDPDNSPSPSPTPELSPAEKAAAKLKYNLFNPTPNDQLRPFNTDRPSKTDSPFTVDAGRFQLEADFANFTYGRYNALGTNTRVETLLAAPTFLRIGLFQNVDFQVLIPTYENIRTDAQDAAGATVAPVPVTGPGSTGTTGTTTGTTLRGRQVTTVEGYGDMLFRLKINLVGDDGGPFIAAVIPFIKAPTASAGVGNGRVEGGINFPINYSLPADFTLFAQTRYDFLYNGDNAGYHALFSNNLGVIREVPGILEGRLSAYGEFASAVSSRESRTDPLVLTADTGLIFQLTPNIAIDVNGFFGLTRGAPVVNVFGGIGVRF